LVTGLDLPDVEEPELGFGWDWRIRGIRVFEVVVSIGLPATARRPEEAKVSVCGVFRMIGPASVAVRDFAKLQAPAILMPFAREALAALTGHGPFGQFLIAPVNVHTLMSDVDPNKATGARQLAEPGGVKLLLGANPNVDDSEDLAGKTPSPQP
jgi:preprotein translocase subunit SecB